MSHFVVLAILPKDTKIENVELEAARLLHPFDESICVKPREVECLCVGSEALRDAETKACEMSGLDKIREDFHSLPQEERTDEKWAELIKPFSALRDELLAEHPLRGLPVPECQTCDGTGKRMTQYNPSSKWDWWVIGGRWDGWIHGPEREAKSRDEMGFNFGSEHHQAVNNCRLIAEIPIDDPYYLPFAILTPKYEWIGMGSIGWWAIVSNSMDSEQWHQTVKTVLAKYSDHLAVAVDCHI